MNMGNTSDLGGWVILELLFLAFGTPVSTLGSKPVAGFSMRVRFFNRDLWIYNFAVCIATAIYEDKITSY